MASLTELYREVHQREQLLRSTYGQILCETLGYETIDDLPEIKLAPRHFTMDNIWARVNLHHMESHLLAKGVDQDGVGLIAMKCDVLDENQVLKAQAVAMICFNGSIGHNELIIPLTASGENHQNYSSPFYSSNQEDLTAFEKLLDGELIKKGTLYWRISKKA